VPEHERGGGAVDEEVEELDRGAGEGRDGDPALRGVSEDVSEDMTRLPGPGID
jgi:hypothetical protein